MALIFYLLKYVTQTIVGTHLAQWRSWCARQNTTKLCRWLLVWFTMMFQCLDQLGLPFHGSFLAELEAPGLFQPGFSNLQERKLHLPRWNGEEEKKMARTHSNHWQGSIPSIWIHSRLQTLIHPMAEGFRGGRLLQKKWGGDPPSQWPPINIKMKAPIRVSQGSGEKMLWTFTCP